MSDYPGALQMLVPESYVFPGAWGYTRRWLILHRTGGGSTAQGIAEWFISGSGGAMVSVHYVIGLDGTVIQTVREADAAGGNGILEPGHDSWWDPTINPNLLTFSIESVDPTSDNSTVMPQAQKDALFPLVRHLCQRWNIPMRPADANGGITGHYSIAPQSRKNCPGQNFPWNELWAYLQGEETTVLSIDQASGYFTETEKDQRWHCTHPSSLDGNCHDIAYGLLQFYRTFGQVGLNGLSIFGLPTTDEIDVPNTKQARVQFCERGVMLYDPASEVDHVPGLPGPCYPAHIDKGPGQDPRIAVLQTQIAELQKQSTGPTSQPAQPTIPPAIAQAITKLGEQVQQIEALVQAKS